MSDSIPYLQLQSTRTCSTDKEFFGFEATEGHCCAHCELPPCTQTHPMGYNTIINTHNYIQKSISVY